MGRLNLRAQWAHGHQNEGWIFAQKAEVRDDGILGLDDVGDGSAVLVVGFVGAMIPEIGAPCIRHVDGRLTHKD